MEVYNGIKSDNIEKKLRFGSFEPLSGLRVMISVILNQRWMFKNYTKT